jgi:hypothetical protein
VRSTSESLTLIPGVIHARVGLNAASDVFVAVMDDERRIFDDVESNGR